MENEWDAASNNEPAPAVPTASGAFFMYDSNLNIQQTDESYYHIETDDFRANMGQFQIGGHTVTHTRSPYIMPLSFDFQRASWKYTFAYAASIMFMPWLVIWSKLTGRITGFRIKSR